MRLSRERNVDPAKTKTPPDDGGVSCFCRRQRFGASVVSRVMTSRAGRLTIPFGGDAILREYKRPADETRSTRNVLDFIQNSGGRVSQDPELLRRLLRAKDRMDAASHEESGGWRA
jgi:hypothetical protein